jgi:hypothetical protein
VPSAPVNIFPNYVNDNTKTPPTEFGKSGFSYSPSSVLRTPVTLEKEDKEKPAAQDPSFNNYTYQTKIGSTNPPLEINQEPNNN